MFKIQKYISKLIIALKEREIAKEYKQLKKMQYDPRDLIEARQLDKLNVILNHAYNTVPYYRTLFNENNLVLDGKVKLKTIEEIKKIPFLTKQIIKNEKTSLYSHEHHERKAYQNSSGGSSGEPVHFLQDQHYLNIGGANALLSYSWRGAEPSESVIYIWGAERDTFEGKKPIFNSVKEFLRNIIVLNCYKMTEDNMLDYIKILNKHKPRLIIAYIESIYEIAKFAKRNNINVEPQHAIHGAAGTVHDFMRDEVEGVFQCKVFNHYGSREVGSIASECKEHCGLHILMDNVFVEIIDEKGNVCENGEDGEVVVTTLNNYSMPLIRYKIGDIGAKSEYSTCACGVNYQKLKYVKGRTTEQFKTKKGSRIDSVMLGSLFYFHDKIQLFQMTQEKLDLISIKIVVKKDATLHEQELEEIKKQISFIMEDECDIQFEFVDHIPKTKTGKFLYTISKV